ncbi:hypothetical protein LE181_02025 [Streptomyces sp. SCA3-4]|uniref:hypothetical protein n=1 Tax=Streptomyces sichuanensis TaxID=2871810 RepID=UPI001CE29F6A|nr:hypothetical protein [Streptomyces sichuanensis]MCA6090952.1 hypothetical protein [Streptomyces sichuanensis]
MSHPDPTAVPDETSVGADPHPWEDPAAARAEIERLTAELAGRAARLAELEPAAAELQQLQEAGKSESQRLTERAEAAERLADQARAELVRAQVAHAKGLTPGQAARLIGTTREELEADADAFLSDLAPADAGPGRPLMQPDPTQGSSGQRAAADPAQMFAGILHNSLHH